MDAYDWDIVHNVTVVTTCEKVNIVIDMLATL